MASPELGVGASVAEFLDVLPENVGSDAAAPSLAHDNWNEPLSTLLLALGVYRGRYGLLATTFTQHASGQDEGSLGMVKRRIAVSAHAAVCSLIGFMAGALLLVLLGLLILAAGEAARPFLWLAPVLVVVDGVGLVASSVLLDAAVGRETKAGYTTLRLGSRRFDEIDVKSGAVIRPAGSPSITRAERRRRMALVSA